MGGPRLAQAQAQLEKTPALPLDQATITAAARLLAECRQLGHALHDKVHTGDRWIAAACRAYGIPLLAIDRIFREVPELNVLEPVTDEQDGGPG